MAQVRKIFHVEFFESVEGRRHFYFGSKAAIFQHFTPDVIGTSYKTLRNIGSIKDKPYTNKCCIIRQGELIASTTKTKDKDL